MLLCAVAHAADTRPNVGIGATKDEVIDAYGWPNGTSQSGTKEILTYAQGAVTLDHGRVERVDFLPNVPWQTPKPRPGTTPVAKSPATGFDPWITSLADATAQAASRHVRILALFVGSDWSPPSKKFLDEVAIHPDFVNPLLGDFVFLKADFPTRIASTPELGRQNETLRERCGVTTYPALVVLDPSGEPIANVDLTKLSTDRYRDGVIAAVTEVRDLLKAKPPANPPAPAAPRATPVAAPVAPPASAPEKKPESPHEEIATSAALSTAEWILAIGIGAGLLLAGGGIWWVRHNARQERPSVAESAKEVFTGFGLGQVPTLAELSTWPVERVRLLVAGLCEEAGYQVVLRPGAASELALASPDAAKPTALVVCWAGTAGPAHAKALRALSGAIVAEEIAQGWFVAPAGFFDEARAVAQERGLTLLDGEQLIAQMKTLPALGLRRVLARAAGGKHHEA